MEIDRVESKVSEKIGKIFRNRMNLKFPKRSSETEWIESKVFEVEIDRVESKVSEME